MFKKIWDWCKANPLFAILIVYFVYRLLKGFASSLSAFFSGLGWKSLSDAINSGSSQDNSGLPNGNVNPNNRAAVILDVANKCQVAIWDFKKAPLGIFWQWEHRWDEDEQLMIDSLNRLNNAYEATVCSAKYKEILSAYGQSSPSLLKDFNKYLDSSEKQKVKSAVVIGLN